LADGRHATPSSRRKPALLIAGVVGALALIALVLVLVTGGSNSPLIGGNPPPTPPFKFKITKTVAVTTAPEVDAAAKAKAEAAAKPVANTTQKMLHTFYSDAFLAPGNWMDGSWGDDVFAMFDHGAQAEALKQIPVLTAGPGAGDAYSTITPVKSNLRSKVLFDPKGVPTSAVDIVFFSAKGANKSGQGSVSIVSKGQYIFQRVGGQWKVVSFSVSRHDKAKKATPASGGPSGSPSPTGTSS
jgi:hypothetical protein